MFLSSCFKRYSYCSRIFHQKQQSLCLSWEPWPMETLITSWKIFKFICKGYIVSLINNHSIKVSNEQTHFKTFLESVSICHYLVLPLTDSRHWRDSEMEMDNFKDADLQMRPSHGKDSDVLPNRKVATWQTSKCIG